MPSFCFLKLWRRCEQGEGATGLFDAGALNSSGMTNMFWGQHKIVSGVKWVPRNFIRSSVDEHLQVQRDSSLCPLWKGLCLPWGQHYSKRSRSPLS